MIADIDIQKIILWHDQINLLCKKINQVLENNGYKATPGCENRIGDEPADKKYEHFDSVSLKEAAELIFEKYGVVNEAQMDMIGFLTAQLKARKFLTYHKTVSGRMYNVGVCGDDAKWLDVPASCRADHSKDFAAQYLHFYTDKIDDMLYDLWIGKKESFEKAYQGYKDFMLRVRNKDIIAGGN